MTTPEAENFKIRSALPIHCSLNSGKFDSGVDDLCLGAVTQTCPQGEDFDKAKSSMLTGPMEGQEILIPTKKF